MKKSNVDTSFLLPGFGEQHKNYNIVLDVILSFLTRFEVILFHKRNRKVKNNATSLILRPIRQVLHGQNLCRDRKPQS